jgi:hypothetical protein
MPKVFLGLAAVAVAGVAGWYFWQAPNTARPPMAAFRAQAPKLPRPGMPPLFHGRSPEEWGRLLDDADREDAARACHALRVLGAEGRPYLIQGLQNPRTETRRVCLENLSVSDLRAAGESGRQLLLALAGDRTDLRIRERAGLYLAQWPRAIPSPP